MSNSLCALATDWKGHIPEGGAAFEVKFDGFRCLRFRGIDGKPYLFTRQGQIIHGCDHIAHRLALIEEAAGEPLFIDGELVVDGTLAATKHWVETGHKFGGEKGTFYAFDVLPYREWQRGGWDAPWYERKAMLKRLLAEVGDPWEWRPGSRGRDEGATAVALVEDSWAADAGDAISEARRIWAAQGEGIVLKDPLAPYRRSRGPAWTKVKQLNYHHWSKAA